jgi:hypothetical protein
MQCSPQSPRWWPIFSNRILRCLFLSLTITYIVTKSHASHALTWHLIILLHSSRINSPNDWFGPINKVHLIIHVSISNKLEWANGVSVTNSDIRGRTREWKGYRVFWQLVTARVGQRVSSFLWRAFVLGLQEFIFCNISFLMNNTISFSL